MLPPKESKKTLAKLFRKNHIADLDKLFSVLETNSRMSVFRRLKHIGYLSSYTDAGRFYTIKEIPVFDSLGLWFYKGIGFSQAGTLKATVIKIVNSSSSGKTPKELLHLLKIRIPNTLYNTLHGLVKSNTLNRHRLEGLCLYTNMHPEKMDAQLKARYQNIQKTAQFIKPIPIETIIAVLVEALRESKVITPPSEIMSRLAVRGVTITIEQIEQIFSQYGINAKKKL